MNQQIQKSIYERLKFVGAVSGRVHAYMLPQEPKLPALVYFQVSGVPDYDLAGESGEQTRIQISACASTYGDAKAVAEAVRIVMREPIVNVQAAFLANCSDAYEDPTQTYRVDMDYLIHS
jgi:hypothetical protein